MYLFFGNHGSSPRAVLQMITAHLQTPMKDRIAHGQLIETNYEIAQKTNTLANPNHIQPDLECLNASIESAEYAVEADYLVNADESKYSKENITNTYENVFKTQTGKRLLKSIYLTQ